MHLFNFIRPTGPPPSADQKMTAALNRSGVQRVYMAAEQAYRDRYAARKHGPTLEYPKCENPKFSITLPWLAFSGRLQGVTFADGKGETDSDVVADLMKRLGYMVQPIASEARRI